MELRHLRYFVALADFLHFGRAAARLRIAQPSLSQQIKQLEIELGTSLLRRTQRRVELTEAGRSFLDSARDILARAEDAALAARRGSGGAEAESLRLGIGYFMDMQLVRSILAAFRRDTPSSCLDVQTLAVQEQLVALRQRRLDAAFLRAPLGDPAFDTVVLALEPMLVALPSTHALARRSALALDALVNDPFVLPSRDKIPVFHDLVLTACHDAGVRINVAHMADRIDLLLGIVAAEGGVALVPGHFRARRARGVVLVPLKGQPPSLSTILGWRRDNTSGALASFVDCARREAISGKN